VVTACKLASQAVSEGSKYCCHHVSPEKKENIRIEKLDLKKGEFSGDTW